MSTAYWASKTTALRIYAHKLVFSSLEILPGLHRCYLRFPKAVTQIKWDSKECWSTINRDGNLEAFLSYGHENMKGGSQERLCANYFCISIALLATNQYPLPCALVPHIDNRPKELSSIIYISYKLLYFYPLLANTKLTLHLSSSKILTRISSSSSFLTSLTSSCSKPNTSSVSPVRTAVSMWT